MRIMWVCNLIPGGARTALQLNKANIGGWIDQLSSMLDEAGEIELAVCAPYSNGGGAAYREWGHQSRLYTFPVSQKGAHIYDSSLEAFFERVIHDFKPDIMHIFGTEMPHALSAVRAFGQPEKTVIHIQGLVSVYADHYTAYLPERVTGYSTFRDFVRRDNILHQKEKFQRRGEFECEALRNAGHVMGRTEWDEACTGYIHPGVMYHHVQEILRACFYSGDIWDIARCLRFRIFMSQGSYPIKGLHLALDAIALLKKKYPDIQLVVAGKNMAAYSSFSERLRESSYQKYIRQKIRSLHLEENVLFLGSRTDVEMKEEYLKCHVFLSASSIDNSPNSVGEAMLLGVPVVAGNVGGVSSLLTHEKEGLLYAADEPRMMAHQIEKLFKDDTLCVKYGHSAHERAVKQYDREEIFKALMSVYCGML